MVFVYVSGISLIRIAAIVGCTLCCIVWFHVLLVLFELLSSNKLDNS